MDVHKNARLTWHSRAELVRRVLEEGQTPKAVATAFGVCQKTVKKWVERYREDGSDIASITALLGRFSNESRDTIPRFPHSHWKAIWLESVSALRKK